MEDWPDQRSSGAAEEAADSILPVCGNYLHVSTRSGYFAETDQYSLC